MTFREYVEDIKGQIDDLMTHEYSGVAISIVKEMYDRLLEHYERTGDIYDVYNDIFELVDNEIIYYSDSWRYLQDSGITDFSEAINDGCHTLTEIAGYYLQDEVYSIAGQFTHVEDIELSDFDSSEESEN